MREIETDPVYSLCRVKLWFSYDTVIHYSVYWIFDMYDSVECIVRELVIIRPIVGAFLVFIKLEVQQTLH